MCIFVGQDCSCSALMRRCMQVAEAWGLLLHAAPALADVEAFRYDLVDVSRQACHLFLPACKPSICVSRK